MSRLSPFPSPLRWAALWLLVAGLVIASLPGAIASTSPPAPQTSTCLGGTAPPKAGPQVGTFTFNTLFGAPTPGLSQFVQPNGITADSSGNLYVLAGGSELVSEFDSSGAFVTDFGGPGSNAGQFSVPQGITRDSAGNLYVADTNNNRIEKFGPTGTFVCQWGTAGSGNGDLNFPTDVAVDASGNVYVTDTANNRIEVFNSTTGNYETQFGTAGTGPGQFDRPLGLALDGTTLFVADTDNNQIQKWTVTAAGAGTFVSNLVSGLSAPTGLAVDGSGNLWVANTFGNDVLEFNETSGAPEATVGSFGAGPGQFDFNTTYDIRAGLIVSGGHVFVCDTGNNRVEEFTPAGATATFVKQIGGLPAGVLALPSGMAVDSAGHVFVADSNNHQVQEFTSTGTLVTHWGTLGTTAGTFQYPDGIALDSSGNAYVADSLNNVVEKWNTTTGTYENVVIGSGVLNQPHGVAVSSSGNVYVADTANNRIAEFGPTGNFIMSFGTGAAPAGVSAPWGVAVDSSGDVYVADTGNNRIVKFGPTGTFIVAMGAPGNAFGTAPGQFDTPEGIALDSLGNVYVADTINRRVQVIDPTLTTVLASFGVFGTSGGQFNNPAALAVDAAGNVYVADTYNNRVQTFTTSSPLATPTPGPGTPTATPTSTPGSGTPTPTPTTKLYLPVVFNNAPVPTP